MKVQAGARIALGDVQQELRDSTVVRRFAETSPRLMARMAGVFFLLTIAAGIIAQMFISGRLVVDGDAAATATNILTHKTLFQLGLTIYLIEMTCQITLTLLWYRLLKPVSRNISLLAAFLGLTGCVIKTFSRLFYIAPLLVLSGAHYLSVFNTEQLQALALLFLNVNDQAAGIALVFFGFSTLLIGYLIVKSTFLPRILGIFAIVGGIGWLTFLYPPFAERLFLYIVAVGLLGGVLQILWFLVAGVNEQRWKEQASTTREQDQ